MKIILTGISLKEKKVESKLFMQKTLLFVALMIIATGYFSCKEIGPNINFSGNHGSDSSGYVDSSQLKNVLIENFTGASCPNCPQGRVILDNLLGEYPGRIEVVEVHEGQLASKVFPNDPDLVVPDGDSLAQYLGPVSFWPSAAIDRRSFETSPGIFDRILSRQLWETYVPQELDSALKVKLGINTTYDDASRLLIGSVTIDFFETITDPVNISVLITESGIIAGQVNLAIKDTFYVHRDVLRDFITPFEGYTVGGNKTQGSAWSYNLTPYTIPGEWDADSCRIIAFVSNVQGSYDVLQVVGKSLK